MIRIRLALWTGLLLLCVLAGCASTQGPAMPRQAVSAAAPTAPAAASWWDRAGDPVLAVLVDQGLAADVRLQLEAQRLAQAEARSRQWQWRVVQWVAHALHQTPEAPDALAARWADARLRKAARIARAYVEVRRLQSLLTLRQDFQDHFRDDADYARWRREAGLVSGVDSGLAGTLQGLNSSALDATRTRLEAALGALARQTGVARRELELRLHDGSTMPRLAGPGRSPCEPAHTGRAALKAAAEGDETLAKIERDAGRTVDDARAAYHLGTGDFATLYVAETAALSAREAHVDALARRDLAAIALWTDGAPLTGPAAGATPQDCHD